MNQQQNKWQGMLEAELKKLIGELRSVGQVNPQNPADWEAVPDKIDVVKADSNEVADQIESYEVNTAILKQLEIRLNEVKDALERIKNGTHGVCRVCGKVIESERLEANPAATTCLLHKDQ